MIVPVQNRVFKPEKSWGLSFDGVDDYVDIADANISGTKTVLLSFKTSSSDEQILLSKCFYTNNLSLKDGRIHRNTESGEEFSTYTNNTFDDGAWHRLIVLDREIPEFYVDGVLQATSSDGDAYRKSLSSMIGARLISGPTYELIFNGNIADVGCFNRFLSEAEIKHYMNHRLTGREPGLVGYWPMIEGSGSTVHDLSNNKNHGTITGATWTRS